MTQATYSRQLLSPLVAAWIALCGVAVVSAQTRSSSAIPRHGATSGQVDENTRPYGTPAADDWRRMVRKSSTRQAGQAIRQVAHETELVPNAVEGTLPPAPATDGMAADDSTIALFDDTQYVEGEYEPIYDQYNYGTPYGAFGLWGRAEYLMWWTKGFNTPALATTSDTGTAQNQAGVLGLNTTDVVFGNRRFLEDDMRSGGRFTLGTWFDFEQVNGLDVTYMFLGEETTGFVADQTDFGILARPFFNTTLNEEDARLIAFPNLVQGTFGVDMRTRLEGAEVNLRRVVSRNEWTELDYILGYRYAQLEDDLQFTESTTALGGATQGSQIELFDRFGTRNSFHGGQLGFRLDRQATQSCWLELLGKFAIGGTRSRGVISGQTTTTAVDGAVSTATGGLLALPTNIGAVEDSQVSTITELGVKLHRQLPSGVTASVGYSFIYWSDVARVGDLIDTTINASQVPPGTLAGEQRPVATLRYSDYWAQGINFGLERRF